MNDKHKKLTTIKHTVTYHINSFAVLSPNITLKLCYYFGQVYLENELGPSSHTIYTLLRHLLACTGELIFITSNKRYLPNNKREMTRARNGNQPNLCSNGRMFEAFKQFCVYCILQNRIPRVTLVISLSPCGVYLCTSYKVHKSINKNRFLKANISLNIVIMIEFSRIES